METAATKFRVVIAESSGRKTLRTVTKPRVALKPGAVKVTVAALGWNGRVGASASVKVS